MTIEPKFGKFNFLDFDTAASAEQSEGRLHWNSEDYTLDIDTLSGSTIQVGQETVMVVRNNTANDIPDGMAVYYTGVIGQRPTVALAIATNPLCRYTLGITTQVISKNGLGLITVFGGVRDFDTSSLAEGSVIYVSETVAGGFQTTQPSSPNVSIVVGVVIYQHATQGSIGVRIRPIPDLSYLTDVNVRGKTLNNNHFLKWVSPNNYWDSFEMPWLVSDHDPTGFNRGYDGKGSALDGDISFIDVTRTFTIEPSEGQSEFQFYANGVLFKKTSSESIVLPATEGGLFVYYDDNGVLSYTTSFISDLITRYVFVAYIYWDSTNSKSIAVVDERHGYHMSGKTHMHMHYTLGASHYDGLSVETINTDSSGTLNTSIQFNYFGGVIADEDIVNDISYSAFPSNIPVYYKAGASGWWRQKTADNFPLIYGGTVGYSGTLIPYNSNIGGVWALTELTNNNCMVMIYFATTDASRPIIGIQGQNQYSNVGNARIGIRTELEKMIKDGLPFKEFVSCWGMIVQTSSSFSNTPKAIFRTLDTGEDYLDLIKRRGL